MTQNKKPDLNNIEGIFTAISVGFFIILLGVLFVSTPDLFGNISDFIGDFEFSQVSDTVVVLPQPANALAHLELYNVMGMVSIAAVVFQVIMIVLRFVMSSSWSKRAETVGNLVYWIGVAFLVQFFLIDTTQWFVFWSTILMAAGVSFIVRGGVMVLSKNRT